MGPRKKVLLGSVLCSVVAMQAITASGYRSGDFLRRHESGDWGEALSWQDHEDNENALADGLAVASAYLLPIGETLWIMTDAGQRITRLALGSEL